jgi:hypothetical protein
MPSMKKRTQNRVDVLQGTLDMLILRTLLASDRNREFKYYRLTEKGRKQDDPVFAEERTQPGHEELGMGERCEFSGQVQLTAFEGRL